MDLFTERLIQKKWETKDLLLSILCFAAAIAASAAAYIFIDFFAVIVLALSLYGAYYLATGFLMVEYEYTVTNDEFNIDKVIAKRKRIALKTYNIKEFTEGGRYDGRAALMLCPDKASDNLYYLEKTKDGIKECVVIDPNETMLKAFSLYMGSGFKR